MSDYKLDYYKCPLKLTIIIYASEASWKISDFPLKSLIQRSLRFTLIWGDQSQTDKSQRSQGLRNSLRFPEIPEPLWESGALGNLGESQEIPGPWDLQDFWDSQRVWNSENLSKFLKISGFLGSQDSQKSWDFPEKFQRFSLEMSQENFRKFQKSSEIIPWNLLKTSMCARAADWGAKC